jgi:trigger factor
MFKKEKIKDLHYSISGALTADEINAAADKILEKYGEKAKIPGFRAGHVPLAELRKRFGDNAFGEAADKLMNADLENFVNDRKIRLAAAPSVDVKNFIPGQDCEYAIEFDILPTLPEIELGKFTITQKTADVPESEIDKALENLRKSRAQAEKQGDDYRAANGDVAVIDFKGFVGEDAFDGGEAAGHHLILGSNSFIPGFEDQIIGHRAGDKFDITVKFPEHYHSEKLASADARFAINVREVRHHILPELNDELAKAVGQDTVAGLREHVKKILGEQYAEVSKREMRSELLEILADKVKLDLPETLVAQEFDMAKREFDSHAGHAHAKDEKWDDKKERREAEKRVKLGLILADWGTANSVSVSANDMQQAIWAEASRYPNPQEVINYYQTNQNAVAMIRGMLFEQKSLDAMLNGVKTKEKKVRAEDLFTQREVK